MEMEVNKEVVMMDIKMKIMKGIEEIEILKRKLKNVCIIMI